MLMTPHRLHQLGKRTCNQVQVYNSAGGQGYTVHHAVCTFNTLYALHTVHTAHFTVTTAHGTLQTTILDARDSWAANAFAATRLWKIVHHGGRWSTWSYSASTRRL